MGKRKVKLNTIDKLPSAYELRVMEKDGKTIWVHSANELNVFKKDQEYISFYKNKGYFVRVKSNGNVNTYPLDNNFIVMEKLKG